MCGKRFVSIVILSSRNEAQRVWIKPMDRPIGKVAGAELIDS